MKIKILSILMMTIIPTIYAQQTDFQFLVSQAVKAPSGHNTQPWLFKLLPEAIEIHPNFEKSLPVVDADNREFFVSLGCAAENLCIAATQKGYETTVSVSEKGIITIFLAKKEVTPNPLFDQITLRQTNRSVFSGKIPKKDIDILKNLPSEAGIKYYFYENGSAEFDTISKFVFRGNALQMQSEAFKNELKSWMRYNKKHQDQTRDGLSYAVFGAPNVPRFIAKPIMSLAINEKTQNKSDRKKIASSSYLVLFTSEGNTLQEWVSLGRVLQRFLLKTTELGIAHAYLNQPNEERQLAHEMAVELNLKGEFPTILLRIGYGKRQAYSLRKPIEEVIISDK
ncbi:MAG: nitroreductase [Capnocytophaga sp.]|nr:nitroreductase [Capnocytophaga sp.]